MKKFLGEIAKRLKKEKAELTARILCIKTHPTNGVFEWTEGYRVDHRRS